MLEAAAGWVGVGVSMGLSQGKGKPLTGNVNGRVDDANTAMGERLDAIQADIRELRALVIDAIERGEPAD